MTKQIFLSNIIITNSEVAVKRRVQMCVFVVCVRVCNRYCVRGDTKRQISLFASLFCTVDKANAFELSLGREPDGATSDTFAYGLVRFVFHLTLFRLLQNQVSECARVCMCAMHTCVYLCTSVRDSAVCVRQNSS